MPTFDRLVTIVYKGDLSPIVYKLLLSAAGMDFEDAIVVPSEMTINRNISMKRY